MMRKLAFPFALIAALPLGGLMGLALVAILPPHQAAHADMVRGGAVSLNQVQGLASGIQTFLSTGTLPAAALPNPASSTLGGVKSSSAASHQYATGINTSGQLTYAQPAATDVSGLAASATTDTSNASNITSGTLGSAEGGSGDTGTAWTSWTPTVSCSGGGAPTYTLNVAKYKLLAPYHLMVLRVNITLTATNTCSGNLYISTPSSIQPNGQTLVAYQATDAIAAVASATASVLILQGQTNTKQYYMNGTFEY